MSVTKAFLKALQRDKLAQASLVRIYATLRHFARWLHLIGIVLCQRAARHVRIAAAPR